jgi:hypothetical protein
MGYPARSASATVDATQRLCQSISFFFAYVEDIGVSRDRERDERFMPTQVGPTNTQHRLSLFLHYYYRCLFF